MPGRLSAAVGVLGALMACSALAAGPVLAPPAQLQGLALQNDAEAAVLTLSLSRPVNPHVFRLSAPERVVIDLPGTRRLARLPAPPPGGVVSALRAGPHAPGGLRVVLELDSPVQLEQQQTRGAKDWRLSLTLRAPAATVPTAASAGQELGPRLRVVRVAHAPGASGRPVVIAVDAGHGGDDPGATGPNGTHEKDVTLAIARALAARIDREPGMRAVLTRNGDYFVDLVERRRRAQAAHADMFVSIHADAIRDREVSGASVYVLSERGASSQAAKILADEQNAADLKGGMSLADQKPELRSVLLNLSQNASLGASSEAADRVLSALDGVGAVRKREVQQAAFVVLKSPFIPSMLVETAYISNPAEERLLRTPAQQRRLADAIFNGIGSYFRKFPPEGSLFARVRAQSPLEESETLARTRS